MTLVRVERAAGVVTVALDRPERKNGITGELVEELLRVLQEIAADPRDRVLVLTGSGGSFCSGMDLSEPVRPDELTFMQRVGSLCTQLFELPRPTIAKVRGAAIGFGANLALCCDLVVASEDAVFGEVFAERGLAMDGGGSWSLPRRVGLAKAKEIAFFGERITGLEGARIGLVNRAVKDDELDASVQEWAERLAAGPRRSLSLLKAGLNASFQQSFAESLAGETLAQALSFRSPEAKEGVKAFRDKRTPDFRALE
ncbi:MAG: enoyl-CoA hydratase-related protein [Actinomycetota bacterium]|nr:enoyl-CoA hydratase-related protein [Actinomycetota bacterium]